MLERVLDSVRGRLPDIIAREGAYRRSAESLPPVRDFESALRAPGLSVVAEFKKASPSKGLINPGMSPGARAEEYLAGGAAALSVLTEPDHFRGSFADLGAARAAAHLPVLRKDFTLHPAQVWETRAGGADAVLLIVDVLGDRRLTQLIAHADEAGLSALVEVHDEEEARIAVDAGAQIIGVNNRSLRTFEVDLATCERIAPLLPDSVVTIAESGISGPADAARVRAAGYEAVLVGEYLSRSASPADAVRELRGC